MRRTLSPLLIAATLAWGAPAPAQMTGILGGQQAASGASYSAEATALFAAMTSSPDTAHKGYIDTAIVCLKTAGLWVKEDTVTALAIGDSHDSTLNWKTATVAWSVVGTPGFAANLGISGVGTAGSGGPGNYYLASATLNNGGANLYGQDDAHVSVYVNAYARDNYASVIATNTNYNGGIGHDDSSATWKAWPNTTSHGLFTNPDTTDADYIGAWTMTRTGSTTSALYKSGAAVASANSWTSADASTGVPATAQRLLFGDGSNYFNAAASTTRIAYYTAGNKFTSGDAAAEASCLTAYLTSIGAN